MKLAKGECIFMHVFLLVGEEVTDDIIDGKSVVWEQVK